MNNSQRLPNVVDMEKAILAAMLLKDGEVVPTVSAIISADDFYREEHKIIYRTILNLYNKNVPPNILSILQALTESDQLEKIGADYLLSLADASYTTAYAEVYAKKIREKSVLRNLIGIGEKISQEAFLDDKPVEQILDDAEKMILSVTTRGETSQFESIPDVLMNVYEAIHVAIANRGKPTGVTSGFPDLDAVTNGFQPSDLILIAARPSMGKTAFALNVALNAAFKDNVVGIFSLEMSSEQLGHRLMSTYSNIDSQRMRNGEIDEDEILELAMALEKIAEVKLFIDDTPGISIMELRSKARRLQAEHGLNLIIIDYLQLMQGSVARATESRQQEISDISRSLKSLARELKVPIVALSQLSRSVELRAEKRPQLSDLRESGSLEQDADIVMFLYREEYYNRETEKENLAELIVAKNRNGPTTSVQLQFKKECMRFGSYASYGEDEY